MKIKNPEKIIILLLLIIFAISYRLLDYPANFSPLAAIALFSGYYFKDKRMIFLPLAILFITDCFLGFYHLGVMMSVYACFAAMALIGLAIKKNEPKKILAASLLSSAMFFIITNFAVWMFAGWYEQSATGLLNCYLAAIPFFRNTLLGDIFFSGLAFGAYGVYCHYKTCLINPAPADAARQIIDK